MCSSFVIADGLSAPAVHRHAVPLLHAVLAKLDGWKLAPLTVVLQGILFLTILASETLFGRARFFRPRTAVMPAPATVTP